MQIRDNLIAPFLKQLSSPIGFMKNKLIDRHAREKVEEFAVATPSIYQKILNLSGGNQQKCLVAMWMGIRPEVIIFDEPTRGVDVGARVEIYHKLREFASAGTGIIMISSDLPELIGMCDRILVMHQGEIKGELLPEEYSEELILSFATGIRSQPLTCSISPESLEGFETLPEDG
jgi:ABC-type sugar transport system ATPase subunit